MNYREDAREKRKKVVDFRPSTMRGLGVGIAGVMALVFVPAALVAQRDASLTCTRDASGQGTCEHVIRHPFYTSRETFDVRTLRSAVLEQTRGKNGMVYRVHVWFGDRDVVLADYTSRTDHRMAASQIDAFAHTPSVASLDARVEGQGLVVSLLLGAMVVFASVIVLGAMRACPHRRLMLDEASGLALLERRSFFRWKHEWSLPLSELRGAAMEQVGKSWRVAIDTQNDGRVTVVQDAREYEPAIQEVESFIRGEA